MRVSSQGAANTNIANALKAEGVNSLAQMHVQGTATGESNFASRHASNSSMAML